MEELPETIEKVVLISDSCGGQNRNLNVLTCLMVAVQLLPIQCIDHIFLERGHTEMSCDTVHSLIEREARKDKGCIGIRGPSDWKRIIRSAAKTHPIEVRTLQNRNVINWKAVASNLVTNRKFLSNGRILEFNKTKMFRFEKDQPGEIQLMYRMGPSQPMLSLIVMERIEKGGRQSGVRFRYAFPTMFELKELIKQKQYTDRIPIAKGKYNDLFDACRKGFIPQEWHRFYRTLPTEDGAASESEKEDGAAGEGEKEDCYSSSGSEFDSVYSSSSESNSTSSFQSSSTSCSESTSESTSDEEEG